MALSEEQLKQIIRTSHNAAFKVITGLTLASAVMAPANLAAKEQQAPQNNVVVIDNAQDVGLDRPHQILTTGANFSNKAKRLYDWGQVAQKYGLNPEDYVSGSKITVEKAAMLLSVIEYEASRSRAVEETLFYNDLIGSLSPSIDIDARIQDAKDNQKNYDFAAIYKNNLENLKNDKYACKQAEDFCKRFSNSTTKNLDMTTAIDSKVMEHIDKTSSKTLSSAFFMNYMRNVRSMG